MKNVNNLLSQNAFNVDDLIKELTVVRNRQLNSVYLTLHEGQLLDVRTRSFNAFLLLKGRGVFKTIPWQEFLHEAANDATITKIKDRIFDVCWRYLTENKTGLNIMPTDLYEMMADVVVQFNPNDHTIVLAYYEAKEHDGTVMGRYCLVE